MTQPSSSAPDDSPVTVTGEARPHPALRTLARACIALARWQREQEMASLRQTPRRPRPDEAPAPADAPRTTGRPSGADHV